MVTTRAQAKSTMAKKKSRRQSQVGRKQKARKLKTKKPTVTEHKGEESQDHRVLNKNESKGPEHASAETRWPEIQKLPAWEIIRLQNDETAPLEEQVKYVKDQFEMLAAYVSQLMEEEDHVQAAMQDWNHTLPGNWPKDFGLIESYIDGFAYNWACENFNEHTLSKEQKMQLIASLDGYCVQEDFDAIISHLPPHIQKIILSKFAEAFLIKMVVETFFEHPFWYIEMPPGAGEEGKREDVTWQGVLPDGAVLERYSSQFEKVNPRYSRYWRCLTTRFCNSMSDSQGNDHAFGEAIQARRHARCRSLALTILANETFQCLLKPTDLIERREKHLACCLIGISDIAVGVLSQNPVVRFHTLRDLEPRFHQTSEKMDACYEHRRDDSDNPRVDGHRVLFLTFPFIFRIHNDTEEDDEIRIFKAVAVMEETRSLPEKAPKKQKRNGQEK